MGDVLSVVGWMFFGAFVAAVATGLSRRSRRRRSAARIEVAPLVERHFAPTPVGSLTVSTREFPHRMRADLQRALDAILHEGATVLHFTGVRKEYEQEGVTLSDCVVPSDHDPVLASPPEYEDIDVGEEQPLRCLQSGIWFLERGGSRLVVLLASARRMGRATGIRCEVATADTPAGTQTAHAIFHGLEQAAREAKSYRGKVLSLEVPAQAYLGISTGVKVHRLKGVDRDEVVLPRATLDLLDRNVVDFLRRRPQLAAAGLPTKKGLLFYGPPGTGKTHTIHYLAKALAGHTTLLITAEQVGLLDEYVALARFLQPSIVVMEDVDLVATERTRMGLCQETILNRLLNEMDGLGEEADVLFLLTTNRPEILEPALASRPGRIDQAIEFPLPDADGRAKLVRLYARGAAVSPELVRAVVARTENVSAAFIKELMRRSVQFRLERDGRSDLELADVDAALQEMLFGGGSLNLALLGASSAGRRPGTATSAS